MTIAITAQIFNASGPVNGLADTPEIEIIRGDTGAVVVASTAMVDLGVGGWHRFLFTPT